MKKILFTIAITLIIVAASYSQGGDKADTNGKETSIRFENRKKKGYYNTTQISILTGNRTTIRQMGYYYYPYSYYSSFVPYPGYAPSTYYDTQTKLQVSPSVSMTHGYMFNEHWAVGIGVGFEVFNYNVFPLFADIRYTLWDDKISPFFSFKAGYAFSLSKTKHHDDGISLDYEPYYIYGADVKNSGGLMLHPEIGVKVPLSEKADLFFTVAYRYQTLRSKVSQEYDYNNYDRWEHKEKLAKLSFGVAVMFR